MLVAMTDQELTKDEVDQRARELARRVMTTPPKPQEWPKKPKATPDRSGASKPRKRGRAATKFRLRRPPPCQTLAFTIADRGGGTLCIVDAKAYACVVAESKLVQIALQMLFSAVLIYTGHAALEDTEEALDRIGSNVATRIFFSAMIDCLMLGKLTADGVIQGAFISM